MATQVIAVQAEENGQTIAFVVGVQNYDEPSLNKLRYTAKDAQDVFYQIQAVSNFDLARSKLLLAVDITADSGSADDTHLIKQSKLSEDTIRNEFRQFLHTIKSNDTVVLYFGGHGTDQADRFLLFLPSDFSTGRQNHYLRYDDLLQDIEGTVDDANLYNVSIVFFANMCGAGTAAGTMSVNDEFDAEFVREWQKKNTFGFVRFAFIPATAKQRNTHEDETFTRSVFAHRLINGLSGAAARDRKITTDSLFQYLDEKTEDTLPRHPDAFDGEITIGTTRDQDALGALLAGTSLLAVAQDIDEPLLLDVAQAQLDRAAVLSSQTGGIARYLWAMEQMDRYPDEAAELLESVIEIQGLPEEYTDSAQKALNIARDTGVRFPTLKSYNEYLSEGSAFYSLLLNFTGRMESQSTELSALKQVLGTFKGLRDMESVRISNVVDSAVSDHRLTESQLSRVNRWIAAGQTPDDSEFPHLLIMLEGSASRESAKNLANVVEQLSEIWPGFLFVMYSLPFPGEFLTHKLSGKAGEISLLMVGDDVNAMAFGQPNAVKHFNLLLHGEEAVLISEEDFVAINEFRGSSLTLLTFALLSGVERFDNWYPLEAFIQQIQSQSWYKGDEEWIVDSPVWIPRWQQSTANSYGRDALLALQRWAALLSAGCGVEIPFSACQVTAQQLMNSQQEPTVHAESISGASKDLFETLKQATELDVGGRTQDALAKYSKF